MVRTATPTDLEMLGFILPDDRRHHLVEEVPDDGMTEEALDRAYAEVLKHYAADLPDFPF